MSFCRERKERRVSTSAFFNPASSPISKIQYPWSFSAAVLSLVSPRFRLSENHSPASLAMRVLFPTPWGPLSTSMESNLQPGRSTRLMAAQRVFLVTART